jgi:uncharacterized protein (DUF1501 family)
MIMLNRRHALLGAAGAAALSFPVFAFAQGGATDKRLLVIILRGALDGLAAAPPLGDPAYAGTRGMLALSLSGDNAALPLDATFALHPSLSKLHGLYGDRQLVLIQACATGYRDRSHFDGQNVLETGAEAPFARTNGWLNAALGAMGPMRPEMAVALSEQAPLILRGSTPVTSWSPSVLPNVDGDTVARLMALYDARDPGLARVLHAALDANAVASDAGAAGMRGGGYARIAPLTQVAARFLKDANGPIAAVVDMSGWDTHANQGAVQGALARNLSALDEGVDAFHTEMGPAWANTVVLVVTEFGRTAAPNGAGGTDHGTGAAAFLAGGAVDGGRVLADWPGLSVSALYQNRDLRPTIDIRGVIKGVLDNHFRVPSRALESAVFPDSAAVRPVAGLIRV